MNERTIELMNEANKVVGFTGNVAELAKVQHLMDKFAELIIRECADVALKEDHEPSDCILSHFGLSKNDT